MPIEGIILINSGEDSERVTTRGFIVPRLRTYIDINATDYRVQQGTAKRT